MNLETPPQTSDIIARLQAATGTENDAQLAKALSMAPSSVSAWRTRNVIPYDACLKVAMERGISLDKLIFGIESLPNPREARAFLLAARYAFWVFGIQKEILQPMLNHIAAEKDLLLRRVQHEVEVDKYSEEDAFKTIEEELTQFMQTGVHHGKPLIARGPDDARYRERD